MKTPFHLSPFFTRLAERCATCLLGLAALLVFILNYWPQSLPALSLICDSAQAERLIAAQWQLLNRDSAACAVEYAFSFVRNSFL